MECTISFEGNNVACFLDEKLMDLKSTTCFPGGIFRMSTLPVNL